MQNRRQKRGGAANRMGTSTSASAGASSHVSARTNTRTSADIRKRAKTRKSAVGRFAVSVKKFEKSCKEVCAILKALSNEQRLLLLVHLLNGPKTVSELVSLCEISQSQVSQYLIRMKLEGLIESEKNGKFQTYYISDARIVKILAVIQAEYCAC